MGTLFRLQTFRIISPFKVSTSEELLHFRIGFILFPLDCLFFGETFQRMLLNPWLSWLFCKEQKVGSATSLMVGGGLQLGK